MAFLFAGYHERNAFTKEENYLILVPWFDKILEP